MFFDSASVRRRYAAGCGNYPGSPSRLSAKSATTWADCQRDVFSRFASQRSFVGKRIMVPFTRVIFTNAANAAVVVLAPAFGPKPGDSGAVTVTSIWFLPTTSWSDISLRSNVLHLLLTSTS